MGQGLDWSEYLQEGRNISSIAFKPLIKYTNLQKMTESYFEYYSY